MTLEISPVGGGKIPLLFNVEKMEKELLKLEQADCPVNHHFYPGLYLREVRVKAGVFAMGHYQKTHHLNLFLKGKVDVVNDDGTTEVLTAPMLFMGKPGRKIGLVLEDMTWLNIYPTDETDVETLENTYFDKSDTWLASNKILEQQTDDNNDFDLLLSEIGITKEQVRAESEITIDLIPFPFGTTSVGVFDSPIEGKGLFAMSGVNAGEIIAPGRINNMRTPAGRYVNHSKKPNATVAFNGRDVDFIALENISGCKGGSLGNEITIDYRDAWSKRRGKCRD